jgi:hypothetical protein
MGLDIRPSLCGRGLGLFAVQPMAKDDPICIFGGERVTAHDLDTRYGQRNTARYAVGSAENGAFFDEEVARSPCAYANDSIDVMALYHAVMVDKIPWDKAYSQCCANHPASARIAAGEGGRVWLVAAKKLPVGTEITHHYGSDYWQGLNVIEEFSH